VLYAFPILFINYTQAQCNITFVTSIILPSTQSIYSEQYMHSPSAWINSDWQKKCGSTKAEMERLWPTRIKIYALHNHV
jgi:hypothetical protein